eukprot:COSAG06_NODE_15865_length_1039_cov_0.920213_1_plen_72_part_10
MAGRLSKLSTHLQTDGGGGGGTSLSASPTATGHGLAPWEHRPHRHVCSCPCQMHRSIEKTLTRLDRMQQTRQ